MGDPPMSSSKALFVNNATGSVWVTDGTPSGTSELPVVPDPTYNSAVVLDRSDNGPFIAFGDRLLFVEQESSGGIAAEQIYVTNGTAAGTSETTASDTFYLGGWIGEFGTKILMLNNIISTTGHPPTVEFLVTDGTSAGTTTFTIAGPPLPLSFNPGPFTGFGNLVLFSATDYSGLTSLWVSNGTAAGTKPLAVAGAGKSGLAPDELTAVGGEALFSGTDSNGQLGLWATNGTATGTHELAACCASWILTVSLDPLDITVFGREALFDGGAGLWITDGTSAGTKELVPSGLGAGKLFLPSDITVFGDKALFLGSGHLWVTDGTAAGTSELSPAGVSTFGLFAGGQEPEFTVLGNKVLFEGADTSNHLGLWVTDGTSAGTSEITVPNSYFNGVSGNQMAVIGNQVEFYGIDSLGVDGLWVTNGTSAGTREIFKPIFVDDLTSVPLAAAKPVPAPSGLSFAVMADKGAAGDTFTVAGRGEAGDTVTLFDGKAAIGAAKVAAGGAWSVTTAKPLAPGAHNLDAHEVDVAGNVSALTAAQSLTITHAAANRATFSAPPARMSSPAAPATMCSNSRPRTSPRPTSSRAGQAATNC